MKKLLSAISILVFATACNMKDDAKTDLKQKQQEANKEYREEVKDASQERSEEVREAKEEYGEEQKEEAREYLDESEGAVMDKESDSIHVQEPEEIEP